MRKRWCPAPSLLLASLLPALALADFQLLRSFTGHTAAVNDVAFLPWNASQFITAGTDATLRVWEVDTGREVQRLSRPSSPSPIVRVACSTSLQQCASTNGPELLLWDMTTGTVRATLNGHLNFVQAIAYSPQNGSELYSASHDGTLRLWDTVRGATLQVFRGHNDQVLCLALDPTDPNRFVSAAGVTVIVWDRPSGAPVMTFNVSLPRVGALALHPAAPSRLLLTDGLHRLALADAGAGQVLANFSIPNGLDIAFDPANASRLAVAGMDGLVRLLESPNGATVRVLTYAAEHRVTANAVAFDPSSSARVVTASDDMTAALWDVTINPRVGPFATWRQATATPAAARVPTKVATPTPGVAGRSTATPVYAAGQPTLVPPPVPLRLPPAGATHQTAIIGAVTAAVVCALLGALVAMRRSGRCQAGGAPATGPADDLSALGGCETDNDAPDTAFSEADDPTASGAGPAPEEASAAEEEEAFTLSVTA